MQGNNKLRVFSGEASNVIADSNLETAVVKNGAVFGSVASSALYNTLSKLTSLACTSLIDFVALQNPSVTFGQETPIESWITAVNNAFASKSALTTLQTGLSNGTVVVNKSTNDANGNNIANTYAKNSDFTSSSRTQFGDYVISKKKLIYNAGGAISDNATFTFNTSVSHPSRLELVMRNNGLNSNFYFDILSVPSGGGSCTVFSINSSDEMVIINLRFPSATTMQVAGSIGLTSYDSWELVKVYQIIE